MRYQLIGSVILPNKFSTVLFILISLFLCRMQQVEETISQLYQHTKFLYLRNG